MVASAQPPRVQLITGAWRDAADLQARATAALRGGVRWIQLRAKERSAADLFEAARMLAPVVREAGGLFVLNDRVDVALACGADGVHLPENGMGARDARRLLGAGAWIARSVHSVDAIRDLAAEPVDAFQLGPVFDTASKRAFGAPKGIEELRESVRAAAGRRVIAVGGVGGDRIGECLGAGAHAISIIGAIWDAADIEAAAREAVTLA